MAKTFKVSLQGLSADMKANGSYDELQLGEYGHEDMLGIFILYSSVEEVFPENNEDLCPASLYVESEGKNYSFYLDNGLIADVDSDAKFTPEEALKFVSGE
jgi:hypothetical protein